MPSKSKKQFRFMKGVEKGNIKAPGLSKLEAKEFTEDNTGNKSYGNLPMKVKAKRKALEKLSKGK